MNQNHRAPGLDVLRGLAIAMVLLYHGSCVLTDPQIAALPPPAEALLLVFKQCWSGVHLFFVLSGFLITGILLDTQSQPGALGHFYVRRAARILPAYLLMVGLLWLTGTVTTPYVLVCLLFLCNMPGLLAQQSEYGPFWSLSVEEQFYLVWPWVLRLCRPEWRSAMCLAVILGMPLWKWALLAWAPPAFQDISYKTWVLADFFAAGALVAVWHRQGHSLSGVGRVLLMAGALCLAWQMAWASNLSSSWAQVLRLSPWLLLFCGTLCVMLTAKAPRSGTLSAGLAWLSHISFGVYLVHQWVYDRLAPWVSLVEPQASPIDRFLWITGVGTLLSVGIAWCSRHTLEQWFLTQATRPHRG